MTSFITEELSHRVNRFRDDQVRTNTDIDRRLQSLEDANAELKHRLGVLTRLLIAKQVFSAAEIASVLAESAQVAVVSDEDSHSGRSESSTTDREPDGES